jgi:hypothetical protein
MTEAEWLACADPEPLLLFLKGRSSDRKFRLFAYACIRRMRNVLEDERSRRAVELAELAADGLATEDQVRQAVTGSVRAYIVAPIVGQATVGAAWPAAWNALDTARRGLGLSAASEEHRQQRLLLSDVFGNPFRPLMVERSWLRWNDGTVPRIAQGIYEGRAFDRLPILADALLDAGCDGEELLAHCRSAGPHVRGCWAIDLLLGKE